MREKRETREVKKESRDKREEIREKRSERREREKRAEREQRRARMEREQRENSIYILLCCFFSLSHRHARHAPLFPHSPSFSFFTQQDDMFTFEVEKEQFAMKPMNCPSHW